MKKTAHYFQLLKADGRKFSMLTCYDYPTAVVEESAGIDIIFVGDSVGTNVLGYRDPTEVTVADMVHHLKAVRRGVRDAYLLVDMPYLSYETPDQALANARIMTDFGADGVKLEGPHPEIISYLASNGIDICGHLGFSPQIDEHARVKGKNFGSAVQIIEEALALQEAGVVMLLFELIPAELGQVLTERLQVPTIGIGAGAGMDGQVLVVNDLLGINAGQMRHSLHLNDFRAQTLDSARQFKRQVEDNTFPTAVNSAHMAPEELRLLQEWISYGVADPYLQL